MSALEQLYQQVILEHAKRPTGRGVVADVAPGPGESVGRSHQVNPTCGDEVTLLVVLNGGAVAQLVWEGQGCSISQASTSVMTGLVVGDSADQALRLSGLFSALMASRGKGLDSEDEMDALGDATAFTGTSQYPARIKCALLGWAALRDAIAVAS